jgi:hypothetical protein
VPVQSGELVPVQLGEPVQSGELVPVQSGKLVPVQSGKLVPVQSGELSGSYGVSSSQTLVSNPLPQLRPTFFLPMGNSDAVATTTPPRLQRARRGF